MRVSKGRSTARIVLCFAALCICASFAAEDKQERDHETAKTMYLQAYSMTTRAKEFRDERDWSEALKLYRAADDIYALLTEQFSDWKKDVVGNMNKECDIQIAFIENMLSQSKPDEEVKEDKPERAASETGRKEIEKDAGRSELEKEQAARRVLRNRIEKLDLDNKEMRRMVERLKREQVRNLDAQKSDFERRISELERENENLRKKLAGYDRGDAALAEHGVQQSIVDLTEENLELNEQLTEALQTIRNLRAKSIGFAKLAEKYDELAAENEALEAREKKGYGNLLEEQKKHWRGKFEEFQESKANELDERGGRIEDLQEKLRESEAKIAAREEKVEEVSAENSELSERLGALAGSEDKIRGQTEQIADLRAGIEELTQDQKREIERLDAVWKQRLEQSRAELSSELANARKQIEEMRTEHKIELKRIGSESGAKREEMQAHQKRELDRIASIWRERFEKTKAQSDKREREWRRERRVMVEIMDEKYAELESERDQLADELAGLEGIRSKVDEQSREIEELLKRVVDLKQRQKDEIEERDAAWSERVHAAEQMVREEYSGIEARLQSAREQLESLDSDWRAREEQQKKTWRAKFEELGAVLEKREAELEKTRNELGELKKLYEASETGKLANEIAEERERNASRMAAVREAMIELKRERDLASNGKFELEGKLMQLERRYKKLMKRLED